MTRILVTGSAGFIGRNLVEALAARPETRVAGYDLGQPESDLERGLAEADAVFHLAGVNRPRDPGEFETGNCDFTRRVCGLLDKLGRRPLVVLSSSIQAELDNPYGVSKRHAEETLQAWAQAGAGQGPGAVVFRLKNVFGKWCRPNYNSVTATFCHNIARGLPVTISDPARELDLVYVDDVVAAFIAAMDARLAGQTPAFLSPGGPGWWIGAVERSFKITLGELEARIQSFRKTRQTLVAPALGDPLTRRLYATYLSYLDGPELAYNLPQWADARGVLAEFIKAPGFGQIFVSRTLPGITRGHHFHHTKNEKFLVLEGEAVIRLRPLGGAGESGGVIEHRVSGRDFRVVDIPPGHTHSIENTGATELVTLFWSSEIFDPAAPDTTARPVG